MARRSRHSPGWITPRLDKEIETEIRKIKDSYGKKVSKFVRGLPKKDQYLAATKLNDVSYEVIMWLTLDHFRSEKKSRKRK